MTIRLYNTATRSKEEFKPIEAGKVSIYVCGVTVYDLCHIGHARSVIVFDILVRYFRARGLDVTYVRNFTDVDDKIIERAMQQGKEPGSLAQEYIDAFHEDMDRLNVIKADREPKATEHIEDMIGMIKTLIEKGFAYVKDTDVFYAVEKFVDYGKLSGRRLEDMKAGSRIAVDGRKNHPMDFTLWKGAKPGEPQWKSPWGPGRPGWHMECSVMSNYYLGSTFDIHGGGKDLLFPHHENERAQSMAANGSEFAHYWIHNGFVTVESEKMSKSLGNFITIRDALKDYPEEVLRFFLLSKHYRSPLDYSKKDVNNLQTGLVRIFRTLLRMEKIAGVYKREENNQDLSSILKDVSGEFLEQFVHIMDDDLNTAGAVGLIFEKVKQMNRLMDTYEDRWNDSLINRLKKDRSDLFLATSVLGILKDEPEDFLEKIGGSTEVDSNEIEEMIKERSKARLEKDWIKADTIRERLKEMGVVLEDGPKGTIWRFDV
jgi:cysteinyl-tRNA synthetase